MNAKLKMVIGVAIVGGAIAFWFWQRKKSADSADQNKSLLESPTFRLDTFQPQITPEMPGSEPMSESTTPATVPEFVYAPMLPLSESGRTAIQ